MSFTKRSITWFLCFSAVLIVGIGFFLWPREANDSRESVAPRPAPEFAFQDLGGQEVAHKSFEGKQMIINLWATWCPYCKEELVGFKTLAAEGKDRFLVVAINRAEKSGGH